MQIQHEILRKISIPTESLFEQVWVINLKRRPERLQRFWSEMKKAKWPFRCARVFEAIDGDKVGVPKFWQTGGGSYGCLRSHLSILERAIMDDVESILILVSWMRRLICLPLGAGAFFMCMLSAIKRMTSYLNARELYKIETDILRGDAGHRVRHH